MSWPEPRYVVRELDGFPIGANQHTRWPGVTVWVADEWNLGAVVGIWRSEDFQHQARAKTFREITAKARALASRLNADHARSLAMT
jgi:hypothetical protein